VADLPDIPHFDLPFRFTGPHPAVVEQDLEDDVGNCVEVIFRTRVGERVELPDFGVDDWVFEVQPLSLDGVMQQLAAQEPRAVVSFEQEPDAFDHLIAKVRVLVSQTEVG